MPYRIIQKFNQYQDKSASRMTEEQYTESVTLIRQRVKVAQ